MDSMIIDLNIIADMNEKDLIDFEVLWDSSQVFQNSTNDEKRFRFILQHFLHLEQLFMSRRLFIGPETLEYPTLNSKIWFVI